MALARTLMSNPIKIARVAQWHQSELGGFSTRRATARFFFFYCLRYRDTSSGIPGTTRLLSGSGPGQSHRPILIPTKEPSSIIVSGIFLMLPCTERMKGDFFKASCKQVGLQGRKGTKRLCVPRSKPGKTGMWPSKSDYVQMKSGGLEPKLPKVSKEHRG